MEQQPDRVTHATIIAQACGPLCHACVASIFSYRGSRSAVRNVAEREGGYEGGSIR